MYYVQDERTSPIAMTRHMQCILLCTVHTILTFPYWRTSFARLRSPMNFSEQTKAIHYYHVYVSSVFHSTIWISIIMCADATGDWRAEHRTYLTIKKYQMKFFSVLLSFTYGDGTSPILCIHYIELIFHQTNTNHFKGFVLWSRLHTDAKTSNRLIRMSVSVSGNCSRFESRIISLERGRRKEDLHRLISGGAYSKFLNTFGLCPLIIEYSRNRSSPESAVQRKRVRRRDTLKVYFDFRSLSSLHRRPHWIEWLF